MATITATSSDQAVSGQQRFKYFKRPIMPRVNAVPPQVLLSTTTASVNPLIPEEAIIFLSSYKLTIKMNLFYS